MPEEEDPRGRILGIDHGSRRIGVAISDPSWLLAHPLATIEGGTEESRLDRLVQIVEGYDVRTIVVGMPLTMKGEEGRQAEEVRRFVAKLARRVSVPIRAWDERLSSRAARRHLRASGRKPGRNRALVDQAAAVEILQSYLDWLRARGLAEEPAARSTGSA